MTNMNMTMDNNIQVLADNIKNGIAAFIYTKKDGTTRYAVGTTNHKILNNLIGESKLDSAKHSAPRRGTLTYFDFSRLEFRQFRKDNLVSIIMVDLNIEDALILALAIAYTFSDYTDLEYQNLMDVADDYNDGLGERVNEEFHDISNAESNDADTIVPMTIKTIGNVYNNEDRNVRWCRKYNGGRGINGVMLAAGGVISSGYDCFGTPISTKHTSCGSNSPIVMGNGNSVSFGSADKKADKPIVESKLNVESKPNVPTTASAPTTEKNVSGAYIRGAFRLELIKSLLTGQYVMGAQYQDARIDAAFEMADKVVARLLNE